MTVGSWEPNSEKKSLPLEALRAALQWHDEQSFPEAPSDALTALQPYAKSSVADWQPAFDAFSSDELKLLCRFFTLAEANWSEWFGGDKNPVIWICKELKNRGDFPDKELTRWIKANTDNRFLPYGNVFG